MHEYDFAVSGGHTSLKPERRRRYVGPPSEAVALKVLEAVNSLSDDERALIRRLSLYRESIQAGRPFWRAGQAIGAKLVLSGWAARQRTLPDGRRQIFGFIIPGDVIGIGVSPSPLEQVSTVALTRVEAVDAIMLREILAWIVDRVSADGGRFVFRDIGGPAERVGTADNDALTILASTVVLRRALDMAATLDVEPPPQWDAVLKGLRPTLRDDGAIADHDGYRVTEEKAATPGALMGIFPYWADLDADTRDRTLRFYVDQWRDYVGSPMLAALYGVWAAWLGDRPLSLKLQEEGFALYQQGRFLQTLEYRLDKVDGVAAGPFFANIGGFLTGLLMGLPALRIDDGDPGQWPRRDVVLPQGWEAVECDRLWIRGAAWRLTARHGQPALLEPA